MLTRSWRRQIHAASANKHKVAEDLLCATAESRFSLKLFILLISFFLCHVTTVRGGSRGNMRTGWGGNERCAKT